MTADAPPTPGPSSINVAPGIVRLGSWLVNWYALEESGRVTVVDAGVSGYRKQLAPRLECLGRSEADVAAVVLTHAHPDHVGAAELLRTELGVPVHVHEADAELARTTKQSGKNEGSFLPYFRHATAWRLIAELLTHGGAKTRPIGAIETFMDGQELDVPGRLRVIHTPGHTDGHCALLFEAGSTLFAGDAICSLNPLTGSRGPQLMPSAFTRSTAQALASLERLKGTGASVMLPGHGEPIGEPDRAADEAKRRGPT